MEHTARATRGEARRPGVPMRGPHRITGGEPGEDARSRIQSVALKMFIEQGYEATSLREIADRLGVSKAALYYHFPTKDDIITSLIDDRIAEIDEVIAWLREQPRGVAIRREFIRRYAAGVRTSRQHEVVRCFERNQTALGKLHSGKRMRDRMLTIADLLSEPTDPLAVRLKRSMAIFALHATHFLAPAPDVTDEQRYEAAIAVALELVDDTPGQASPQPDA